MDQTKKLCVELYYSKQFPAKTLYPHFSGARLYNLWRKKNGIARKKCWQFNVFRIYSTYRYRVIKKQVGVWHLSQATLMVNCGLWQLNPWSFSQNALTPTIFCCPYISLVHETQKDYGIQLLEVVLCILIGSVWCCASTSCSGHPLQVAEDGIQVHWVQEAVAGELWPVFVWRPHPTPPSLPPGK